MIAQTPKALVFEHPFVRGFDPHEIEQLASLAREVRFAKDEVIYHEGGECQDFYLLVSGRVVLEITPASGAFHVDTVEPGDEFGWSAVLMGRDRVLQARALEDTLVLAFDGGQLRALCERDTAFGYDLMHKLLASAAERLQAARLQVMDMNWPVARLAGA